MRRFPPAKSVFAVAALCILQASGLLTSLALAAEDGELDAPKPYDRLGSVVIPITFGGSLTDLIYTPTNEYLNSSATLDTGLDLVFSDVLEWSVIDLGVTGSTGSIETPSTFREYGLYSVTTVPSINIPWKIFGSSALRFFAGLGFAKPFAGNFGGTALPLQATGVFTAGMEMVGNFSNYSHNWHYEGLGLTYIDYLQNSPISTSLSIAIHAKVSYDLVLLK